MVHYKGGKSVASILVPGGRNTLMLRARRHVQENNAWENSSMGQGVKSQTQRATRLPYKACFNGSVERNMETKLGQRKNDENVNSKTQ
jgi:hypothetical protein